MSSADVVVLGAGHNGLVAGNYLADAGLRVIVLEAAPKIGGMTASQAGLIPEAPDHVINTCAVDPLWWEAFPPSRELGLDRFGLRHLISDPCYAYLHPDGDSLCFWHDPRRTADEIGFFSKSDAAAFLEFARFLDGFLEVTDPLSTTNPTRPGLRNVAATGKAAFQHRKELGGYAALLLSSGTEIIDERFDHPVVRSALHLLTGGFYSPSTPGSAFLFIALAMFHRFKTGRPAGGTGAITDALARRFQSRGGIVRTGSPVSEIIVEANRATGVVLADGTTVRAERAVLATCDPATTLGRLLPSGTLPPTIESRLAGLPTHSTGAGVLKVDVAMKGKLGLTRFNRKRRDGLDLRLPSHFLGTEDGYRRSFARSAAGLLPEPAELGSWSCIPTALDPSQAPDGQDVLYIYSPSVPASPDDGWENVTEKMGQIAIDHASIYYEGVAELELGRQIVSHEDIGRNKWCAPVRGNLMHLDMIPSRSGPLRPARGLGGYTTPVDHLYLGGAGSHPGGGVTGVPGYNASREVLQTLKRAKRARKLGGAR